MLLIRQCQVSIGSISGFPPLITMLRWGVLAAHDDRLHLADLMPSARRSYAFTLPPLHRFYRGMPSKRHLQGIWNEPIIPDVGTLTSGRSQGDCILTQLKHSLQIVCIPSCLLTFSFNTTFCCLFLFQQIQCHVSQNCHISRSIASKLMSVFIKCNVQ